MVCSCMLLYSNQRWVIVDKVLIGMFLLIRGSKGCVVGGREDILMCSFNYLCFIDINRIPGDVQIISKES